MEIKSNNSQKSEEFMCECGKCIEKATLKELNDRLDKAWKYFESLPLEKIDVEILKWRSKIDSILGEIHILEGLQCTQSTD